MTRRAVDTNVLVRILADNGSDQAARARALLSQGTVVVSPTVLLEAEWVLRSRFHLTRSETGNLISRLLLLDMVEVETRPVVERALRAFAQGFDFADALHLYASDADEFVTFDRDFARKAEATDTIPVRLL